MEKKEKVGEDGILNESQEFRVYDRYQTYLDLKMIGYTDREILQVMKITIDELVRLRVQFEGSDD